MNLQVNFIRPAEIRSPSLVSIRSLILIAVMIAPLVLVLLIAYTYVTYLEQQSALKLVEGRWESAQRKKTRAAELVSKLNSLNRSQEELSGWRRSRLPCAEALLGLQQQVPPTIQLKNMNLRQTLEFATPANVQRHLKLILNGRCQGPDAEAKVEEFRRALTERPPFGPLVQSALVAGFREDTEAGAGELDRVFQVEVVFKPRSFREAAGK